MPIGITGRKNGALFRGNCYTQKTTILYDRINVLLGYQGYTESRHDRKINRDALRHREEDLDIFSFNIDFGKKFDNNAELYYGSRSISELCRIVWHFRKSAKRRN